MTQPLVLSLFPGIGLLDRAFEEEGFCVVRGPDVLWGGDVHRFHPPRDRFDGVIGGPPCQEFSRLKNLNPKCGEKHGNLIPEFERCVLEARPRWWVMENVPEAPVPGVVNYTHQYELLHDHHVGGETRRLRRFTFAWDADEDERRDDVDPVERARCAIVRSFMGFGSASLHARNPRGMRTRASNWTSGKGTGFRASSSRSGTTPAHDWAHYPEQIAGFVDRLRGVVIENRHALEVIAQHDRLDALIYCDPPYPQSTRDDNRADYSHEMSDDDHRVLSKVLHGALGMVLVSGYPCQLYDEELYAGWERHEREHLADGAKRRTEVVWLNSAASRARHLEPSLALGEA